jgi:hypothetical protein
MLRKLSMMPEIGDGISSRPLAYAPAVVQLAPKHSHPFVIPKPGLWARNLLAARSEAEDSSRDKAALRNDNSLGIYDGTTYAPASLKKV